MGSSISTEDYLSKKYGERGTPEREQFIREAEEFYFKAISRGPEWTNVEDAMPVCYARGDWDGTRSSLVLVETKKGDKYLALCYELNGEYEWYDEHDYGLRYDHVVKWRRLS